MAYLLASLAVRSTVRWVTEVGRTTGNSDPHVAACSAEPGGHLMASVSISHPSNAQTFYERSPGDPLALEPAAAPSVSPANT